MVPTKDRSLVVPQGVVVKTQAPRLRRKLQKSVTKQRSISTRRPGLGSSNEVLIDNKYDTANPPSAQAQAHASLSPAVLPSPDLRNDSKWTEFFRGGGGCLQNYDLTSLSQDSLVSPVNIIPELSHLVVRDAAHHHRSCHRQEPRPLLFHSLSQKSSKMRRRAKTPIFSIGQLEAIPRPANALGKTSSVELIAEQYRALLDPRASLYSDSHSEPPPSRHGDDAPEPLGDGLLRRQQSSEELNGASPIHAPTHQLLAGLSPTSDDGTLVSFEEDTIYFKPVSFSPEPRSPQPHFQPPMQLCTSSSLPTPPPDVQSSSLSLQICLDLLTRDLSSALASRPGRSSPETSALQVWCMIEAYERLRDQLASGQTVGPLADMFDTWLRALYAIHDGLTGSGEDGEYMDGVGESDYDEGVGELD